MKIISLQNSFSNILEEAMKRVDDMSESKTRAKSSDILDCTIDNSNKIRKFAIYERPYNIKYRAAKRT